MKFLFLLISLVWPATEAPNEILILPTLHKLHHEVSSYSFEALATTLAALKLDILVVELTDADLKSRKKQRMKVEYNEVVFDFSRTATAFRWWRWSRESLNIHDL